MIARFRSATLALLLASVFGALSAVATGIALAPSALADDSGSSDSGSGSSDSSDSGSDDDSPDDGDDAGASGPESGDDHPPRLAAPAPVVPAPPLLREAPDEIVVAGLDAAGLALLESIGYRLLAVGPAPSQLLLLGIPAGLTVAEALEQTRTVASPSIAVPNTYYRTQGVPADCVGDICGAWSDVGWPPPGPGAAGMCHFAPYIGVIDTGVNVDHEMLRNAEIVIDTIGANGAGPSETRHGTAVVAMFVGDPAGRVPGLAPAARIRVADPFGTADGEVRADLFGLVAAIGALRIAGVEVISMSLAGDDNQLLRTAIEEVMAADIPVVAAVGNAGAAAPALYPAGYPGVVAVTAVDLDGAVYRRAIQGPHVQIAAPGVEVATAASISGVRPQTGTSFAVPFVTIAVAALRASGTEDILGALAADAVDLGAPGHDPVFGWGLVQIADPCAR